MESPFVFLFLLCMTAQVISEGFLEDELPLEIVTTTPARLIKQETTPIRGKQAITVVFSRPVIALGSDFGQEKLPDDLLPFSFEPDVAGGFRWVTTYIARFDPEEDWPRDMEIEMIWNLNLTTYDGVQLIYSGPSETILKTPSNTMSIRDIVSETANDLTDDNWSAFRGLKSDILPEVVKDGVMELSFDVPVNLTILQNEFKVREIIPSSKSCRRKRASKTPSNNNCLANTIQSSLRTFVRPCIPGLAAKDSNETTCANVTLIAGRIKDNTKYELYLEEGIKYSKEHGALKEEMFVSFGGLRPFKVPFKEAKQIQWRTRFMDIWLPHGTGVEQDFFDIPLNITDRISGNPVSYEVQELSESVFRLITNIQPGVNYLIETSNSTVARDGYGQELVETSVKINAPPVQHDYEMMSTDESGTLIVVEQGQQNTSQFVVFTTGPKSRQQCESLSIWPIEDVENLVEITEDIQNDKSYETILGDPAEVFLTPFDDPSGQALNFDISQHLAKSGVAILRDCDAEHPRKNRYDYVESKIMIETTMNAIFIPFSESNNHFRVLAFITELETGEPVQNATVHLYASTSNRRSSPDIVKNNTNEKGIAEIAIKTDKYALNAVIEYNGKLQYVPDIYTPGFNAEQFDDALILDRKLIQPGEQIFIKGYVSERDGLSLIPGSGQNFGIRFLPSLHDDDGGFSSPYPVALSKQFGSYNITVDVPENATLGEYQVQLVQNGGRNGYNGVYYYFTVGEPRTPTVEMQVSGSEWTPPSSTISLEVEATSFIGASVGDQEVTISWEADVLQNDEQKKIEGKGIVTTDSEGKASYELDLSSLEAAPAINDKINFDIKWIGPTGELIEEEFSTTIAYEDLSIETYKTVSTDIPLQIFGVGVELTTLDGSKTLPKRLTIENAVISLKQISDKEIVPTHDYSPLPSTPVQQCTFSFDSLEWCDFQLPSMGLFVLETCVEIPSRTICDWETIGKTEEEWSDNPLVDFIPIGVYPDDVSGSYKVGDEFEVVVENPYENVQALIGWGNYYTQSYRIEQLPFAQRTNISFNVEEHCQFGCLFYIGFVIPRQTRGLATELAIPISKLFDPASPHTDSWKTQIRSTLEEEIDIDIAFPEAVDDEDGMIVRPGESSEISISLNTDDETEVTVVVVDKSILELVPNPLTKLSDVIRFYFEEDFTLYSASAYMIAPGALQTLIERFEFEKELNPWFDISYSLTPDQYSDVDLDREEYINRHARYITIESPNPPDGHDDGGYYHDYVLHSEYFDESHRGFAASYSIELDEESSADSPRTVRISAKSSASASISSPTPDSGTLLRSQSAFLANALFSIQVIKGGKGSFNFTAPENLGTFVVRAYAASKTALFGQQETEIIVRRVLSLTPSTPRFVRVQDRFQAGAVITASGSSNRPVIFQVEVEGPVNIVGRSEQTVRLGKDQQEEALFEFEALAVGEAIIRFIAAEKRGGGQDAVEVTIPIEAVQESVVIRTSFVLQASTENTTSAEGLDLPSAVAGSGFITVASGVGQQPAILALIEQMHDSDPDFLCPYSYDRVLAAAFVPIALNPYSPWDVAAEALSMLIEEALTRFQAAVELLTPNAQGLVQARLGLVYFLTCEVQSSLLLGNHPNLNTNAEALWLFHELENELNTHDLDIVRNSSETLLSSRELMASVFEKALIDEAKASRKEYNQAIDNSIVAFSRSILGTQWEPTDKLSSKFISDLSMNRLQEEFEDLDPASQAYYILSLLDDPNAPSRDQEFARAVEAWTTLYRVTGRTAYIAAYEGASQPASNRANALILLAMTRIGNQGQLLPKLAAYVGAPVGDYYGFTRFSDYDMIVAIIALAAYDASRNNTNPDVTFTVNAESRSLIEATFNETSPPVVSNTLTWEDVGEEIDALQFIASGSGEVSVAVTLNFVPAELLPFPSYRGIHVERIITLDEQGGRGLSSIPVGNTVFVEVQFMTPDSLSETTVRVLMPGGLEPIDPNIFGNTNTCPIREFYASYYYNCPEQETKPSVVTFTFSSVPSGTHTVTFRAVAATVGVFVLPPVRVFVNEQPEVMGLSSAGSFEVCAGSCKAEYIEDITEPIPCSDNCNGNGACNLKTGTCNCFRGFYGEACEESVQ